MNQEDIAWCAISAGVVSGHVDDSVVLNFDAPLSKVCPKPQACAIKYTTYSSRGDSLLNKLMASGFRLYSGSTKAFDISSW